TAQAEETRPARRVKATEDAVAGLDARYVRPGVEHRADKLVADRESGLDLHAPVVDVEVRAADARRLDPDDRVAGVLECRLGPIVDPNLAGGLEGDGSHRSAASATSERDRFLAVLANFSSPIPKEPLSRLAAQPPGPHQRPQSRRQPVALLAEFLAQTLEHGTDVIEPDLVRPRKYPARVVEPVDHPGIDVLGAPDALADREGRLVDDLADHPAQHEPGGIADPRDMLAERREEALGSLGGRRGRERPARELDQPSIGQRREDVGGGGAPARVDPAQRPGGAADRLRAALQWGERLLAWPEHIDDQERNDATALSVLGRDDLPAGRGGRRPQRLRERPAPGDHHQAVAATHGRWLG